MTVAFVAKSAAGAYSTGNPSVTLPAGISAGDGIYILVGSKPDTAGPASATGYTNIGAFTGGTGTTGVDAGPTRIGVLFKEADGTEGGTAVTVTVPTNNVSWALGWVLSKTLGGWDNSLVGGDDSTGASAAYSATSTSSPSVAAGDYIIAACVIPTDACTVAVNGALTNNLTRTSTTFGTATASGNLESASGNDIGGHVRGVPVSTASGSANLVYTVTFTGSTNTYGPTAFVRARDVSLPIARTVDDTTGVTDSGVARAVNAAGTDDSGLTDSATTQLATEFPRSQTDTVGLVDTRVVVVAHARSQTDTVGLVDTRVVVVAHARSQTDTVGLVDAAAGVVAHARSQTDTVGLVDDASPVLTGGSNFTRTVDDATGVTDSRAVDQTATVDNQVGLTDSRAVDQTAAVDDATGVTDAGVLQSLAAVGTDGVGLVDSTSVGLVGGGFTRTVDDGVGLVDAASPVLNFTRTVNDGVGLVDAASPVLTGGSNFTRTVTDTTGVTDLGDSLTTDVAETVDNPVGVTDSVSVQASGAPSRTHTDTVGLVDAAAVVSAHARAVTDPAGVVDSIGQTSAGAGTRTLADTVGLVDAVTYSSTQTVTDTLGAVDAATSALAAARSQSDTVGLVDAAVAAADHARAVTDPAGVVDSTTQQSAGAGARTATDAVGLSDAVTYSSTQTLVDSLGLVDAATLAMQAARTAADVLALTDAVAVSVTRAVTDSAGLTDSTSALALVGNAYGRFVTDSVGLVSTHQQRQLSSPPAAGVTTRPTAGTTARPTAGVTFWHPFIPD